MLTWPASVFELNIVQRKTARDTQDILHSNFQLKVYVLNHYTVCFNRRLRLYNYKPIKFCKPDINLTGNFETPHLSLETLIIIKLTIMFSLLKFIAYVSRLKLKITKH